MALGSSRKPPDRLSCGRGGFRFAFTAKKRYTRAVTIVRKEGAFATWRDSNGKLITKIATAAPMNKETWRALLRRATDGGFEPFLIALSIARGEAQGTEVTMPNGEKAVSEPIVPTPAIRLAAAQWLGEMIHGKAVVQTEMRKAETEDREVEKIRALSDEELRAQVVEALKVIRPGLPNGDTQNQVPDQLGEGSLAPAHHDQLDAEPLGRVESKIATELSNLLPGPEESDSAADD